MKKIIAIVIFTILTVILFGVLYPIGIWGIAQLAPNHGKGETILINNKVVGYQKIGQNFNQSNYFWGRPSAVNYNSAASGGSNKAASNSEYLIAIQKRIDTFLVAHPYLKKTDIPSDIITASGSGLDPNISPQGALIQVKRVAKARNLPENTVKELVLKMIAKPAVIGTETVNVLQLNIALNNLK